MKNNTKLTSKKKSASSLTLDEAKNTLQQIRNGEEISAIAQRLCITEETAVQIVADLKERFDPARRSGRILSKILMSLGERSLVRDKLMQYLDSLGIDDIEPKEMADLILKINRDSRDDDKMKVQAMKDGGYIANALESLQFGFDANAVRWLVKQFSEIVFRNTTDKQRDDIAKELQVSFRNNSWSKILNGEMSGANVIDSEFEVSDRLSDTLKAIDYEE